MICCKCKRPIEKSYGRVTDLGNYCRECAVQNEEEAKKSIVEQVSELSQIISKETAKAFVKRFIFNLLNKSVIDDEYTLEELEFDGKIIKETLNDTLNQFGVEVEE